MGLADRPGEVSPLRVLTGPPKIKLLVDAYTVRSISL